MIKMKTSYKNQNGFVSIVVCLIIMIILSLVTIGFAQIMAREQRQALDRQLSTQAFYAAESGVNDARSTKLVGYDSTCTSASGKLTSLSSSVKVTCVFVNSQPLSIKKDNVSMTPFVFPIRTSSGGVATAPKTITIKWSNPNPTAAPFRSDNLQTWPASGLWAPSTAVGRFYLMPFSPGYSRDNLVANTGFGVLNPSNSGSGTANFSDVQGSGYGKVINGSCASNICSATITLDTLALGFNPGVGGNELYIALSSLYKTNTTFEVTAKDTNGVSLNFNDVQAVVDSTGRTTDVLRRIEARVPLTNDYNYPVGALVGGDICKLWTASPVSSSNDSAKCP